MGNCGSSQAKQEESSDIRINHEARHRTRQPTSPAHPAPTVAVEVSPGSSKTAADKRTEENEQLRVIVSATNRKFIGVASLSYETPPGLEEASQRYKVVVLSAPPRVPTSLFALPRPSAKTDATSIAQLLGTPMDENGVETVQNATNSLNTALEEINIPINPQDLIVEWSMASLAGSFRG